MDKDVKNTILNMAETQLDEVLQMNGFKRRSNSLIYARKSKESTQKIEIMYFLHPSYYNNALAHIYPQLSVYYPDIQELAKKILGDTIPSLTVGKIKMATNPVNMGSVAVFYFVTICAIL